MKNNQKIETHVLKKYSVIKKLGSGAYGHVWKVQSKQTKKVFALKKIFDAFQHSTDAQRTYREISVLKKLSHQKVIDLEQVIPAQNNQDIYLVFQYMQSDLYHLIYDGKLQPIHIKYIIYQLLQGLNYLHNSNLIHRDLKPSNILLNSDCSLKICDFGLVRYIGQKGNDNILTENVATRWYRAPQVLLGSNSYDTKADIWSTGCIIAQMLLKNPIFPGNCTTNQLQRILRLTGQPSQSDIAAIQSELTQVMISQVNGGKIKQIDYFAKIEKQNHSVLELLNKMLSFNPNKRPSALEALKSPYFQQFFNQKDLIVKKQPIFMEVDENIRLQKKQYLQIIKQKFTKCNQIIKEFNHSHVSNSPKRFSEIRNSRKSSKSIKKIEKIQQQKDSHSKTKTLKRDSSTNLFKQLCQKTESINKKKDNSQKKVSNYQSSLDKENKSHQKNKSSNQQKANLNKTHMNFTHLKKQQKVPRASFTGLRKVSKLQR